jgi:hypothetical protein
MYTNEILELTCVSNFKRGSFRKIADEDRSVYIIREDRNQDLTKKLPFKITYASKLYFIFVLRQNQSTTPPYPIYKQCKEV